MKTIWVIITAVFLGIIGGFYILYFANKKKIYPMRSIDRIKYSAYLSLSSVILTYSFLLLMGAYETYDLNKNIPLEGFSSLPMCGAIEFPFLFICIFVFLYNSEKSIKFLESKVNSNPKVKVIYDEMRRKRDR